MPKVTIVAMVSFARKNETIESIAATLEQSALHLFLAAEVPASIQTVSLVDYTNVPVQTHCGR